MALVRLTKGGGGGELHGAELVVTIEESSFAGKTVYLYKGSETTPTSTKVFSTTATGGKYKATFTVQEVGTYKIYSTDGTDEADETQSVTSDNIVNKTSLTVALSVGFNFALWLTKGGVTQTFSSLDDVLADQKTVRQLMTVHDSVDYLYDSYLLKADILDTIMASTYGAKWLGLRDYACDKFMANATAKATMLASSNWEYILKDKVPTMTSDTAPYGTAFGSAVQSGFAIFNAFSDNASSYYAPSSTTSGTYLGYEFTNPTCIQKFRVVQYSGIRCTSIQLCGSNISSNLSDMTNIGNAQVVDALDKTIIIEHANYYKYYCVKFITVSDRPIIQTLQFYGRSLNVSVPTMSTNNTTPYGEAKASNHYSSYDAYLSFDKNSSTYWEYDGNCTNQYIQYKFTNKVCVKSLLYKGLNATYSTSACNFKLYGFDNETDTPTFIQDVNATATANEQRFTIANNNSYKYYRLVCQTSAGNYGGINVLIITMLDFYGVDYTEREFATNSKVEYIYDHGVKVKDFNITNFMPSNTAYSSLTEQTDYLNYVSTQGTSSYSTGTVWGLDCSIDFNEYNDYYWMSREVKTQTGIFSIQYYLFTSTNLPSNSSFENYCIARLYPTDKTKILANSTEQIHQNAYIGFTNVYTNVIADNNIYEIWVTKK